MGSARSAFVISALLCVSSSAMSSELESPREESRSSGLLGHTIIRTYGAIIPAVPEQILEHAGWGTGLTVSYGVARAIQLSLGLAYYQFEFMGRPDVDCDCSFSSRNAVRQTTMSVEVQSAARSWLRPWFGVGFGVYEMTETRETIGYSYYPYRSVTSGTQLGINWGVGLSAQLDQRLAVEFGGRYHHSFRRAFLTNDQHTAGARLLGVQAGLSYVMH